VSGPYANPTLTDCVLQGNASTDSGGGIYVLVPSDHLNSDGGEPSANDLPVLNDTQLLCNTGEGQNPAQINTSPLWGQLYSGNGNTFDGTCSDCSPDVNGDLTINVLDLVRVLAADTWDSTCPATCPEDINGDLLVNVQDLLLILHHWNKNCPVG